MQSVTRNFSDEFTGDLFATQSQTTEVIGPGACVLRGFANGDESQLLDLVRALTAMSPWRHMITPGGFRMSVAMTNAGEVGWVADASGYRYDSMDPLSRQHWPAMPALFLDLARRAASVAGFDSFIPDACLINCYEPGARLSLHRDYDERDAHAPIVSVSLGVAARFIWGGLQRTDALRRLPLHSGDVVVWGGPSRFIYHGIAPLRHSVHPLTGVQRINLTFRKTR